MEIQLNIVILTSNGEQGELVVNGFEKMIKENESSLILISKSSIDLVHSFALQANSGIDVFDFTKRVASLGSEVLLAEVYDDEGNPGKNIAYKLGKKVSATKVKRELAELSPTIALSLAVSKMEMRKIKEAISNGADPNVMSAGAPAIFNLMVWEKKTLIKLFLESGVNIDSFCPKSKSHYSYSGVNVLHGLIHGKNYRLAMDIVDRVLDVSAVTKNDRNETALHLAISTKTPYNLLKKLLDAGARLDIKDVWGKTPLDRLDEISDLIRLRMESQLLSGKVKLFMMRKKENI